MSIITVQQNIQANVLYMWSLIVSVWRYSLWGAVCVKTIIFIASKNQFCKSIFDTGRLEKESLFIKPSIFTQVDFKKHIDVYTG